MNLRSAAGHQEWCVIEPSPTWRGEKCEHSPRHARKHPIACTIPVKKSISSEAANGKCPAKRPTEPASSAAGGQPGQRLGSTLCIERARELRRPLHDVFAHFSLHRHDPVSHVNNVCPRVSLCAIAGHVHKYRPWLVNPLDLDFDLLYLLSRSDLSDTSQVWQLLPSEQSNSRGLLVFVAGLTVSVLSSPLPSSW